MAEASSASASTSERREKSGVSAARRSIVAPTQASAALTSAMPKLAAIPYFCREFAMNAPSTRPGRARVPSRNTRATRMPEAGHTKLP